MSSPPVAASTPLGESVASAPEIRETHTGMVILVGDRAYKVKKPVVTDFLDFSTVDRREHACERELRLNRRLAAHSYLGLAHLTDPLGGAAEPVVVMRRLPDSARLTSLVRRGELVEGQLTAIALQLATFHRDAVRGNDVDTCAGQSAIRDRWRENLAELSRHVDAVVPAVVLDEVDRLAMRFIDGRGALFAERIAARRVVDGHGDLTAEDVFCLPEGPALLDCLEFDDRLRFVDGLDDAAFLAMDLEFLRRPDLGEYFLEEYRRHAHDAAPSALAHFYVAYRAVVRAKVDCIRVGQHRDGAAVDARRHLDLALQHLRAGTVRLILVGGGPGTGKTTLARGLSERLGARVISSDDVRREMQAEGRLDGAAGVFGEGLYSPDRVDAVYAVMLDRAADLLAAGRPVILDGTWRDPRHRASAHELARESHCPSVHLACTLPIDEAMARIASRPASASDATPGIAAAMESAAAMGSDEAAWAEAHPIDTSRPLSHSLAEAQQICCLAF
jgi:uncharacterized protein